MTAGPGRFAGKVVVVTGAGSGIGAAAADRFVAEGARVVYADRDAGGSAESPRPNRSWRSRRTWPIPRPSRGW